MDDTNEPLTVSALAAKPLVHRGCRVVTLAQVDELHERASGTARRNFNENRQHLDEGEDFFILPTDEIRSLGLERPDGLPMGHGLVLLTESGYLLLCKSLRDDRAWRVQKSLVRHYFRLKDQAAAPPLEARVAALEAGLQAERAARVATTEKLLAASVDTNRQLTLFATRPVTRGSRADPAPIPQPPAPPAVPLELERVKVLLAAWFETFGDRPVTSKEIVEVAKRVPSLARALATFGKTPLEIGYALRAAPKTPFGGLFLSSKVGAGKRTGWVVRPVEAPALAAQTPT